MEGAKERTTMEILFAVHCCLDGRIVSGNLFSYKAFYQFMGNGRQKFNFSTHRNICCCRVSRYTFHLQYQRKKV